MMATNREQSTTTTRLSVGGSTQAGVLLARRGQVLPSDDMYAYLPVLYHIAFHSIGSRLFRIREKTGLFYGAQGTLGVGMRKDHPGMDVVCTTVEPSDAARTVGELQTMLTGMSRAPDISSRELHAAQRWYENKIIDTVNSPSNFADMIVQYLRLHGTVDYKPILLDHVRKVKNVTVTQINDMARAFFKAPYTMQIIAH